MEILPIKNQQKSLTCEVVINLFTKSELKLSKNVLENSGSSPKNFES